MTDEYWYLQRYDAMNLTLASTPDCGPHCSEPDPGRNPLLMRSVSRKASQGSRRNGRKAYRVARNQLEQRGTEMMNQAIKIEWAEWLEDEEHQQGPGALRSAGDKYCCLGGLCELAVKHGVIPAPTQDPQHDDMYRYGDEHSFSHGYNYTGNLVNSLSYLPQKVMEWAGLQTSDPQLYDYNEGYGYRRSATTLNDNNYPFAYIADLIRKDETL